MDLSLIERVEETLLKHKKEMHVNEIAEELLKLFPSSQENPNDIANKISSVLSKDVKRKESKFSKPKNKQGGFRKGIYRLKRRKATSKLAPIQTQPKVTSQYTGKVGEHAVLSELLFRGFDSSMMAVDDGIDVVASKANQYFHIQVKTSNGSNGTFGFKVTKDRFVAKHSAHTFYVCVLRRITFNRYTNDFVIFTSSEIKRLIDSNFLNQDKDISLQVKINESGNYILNNKKDITWCINNWEQIT